MRLGIVGAEGAKFNTATERAARSLVRQLLQLNGSVHEVVSGACHLGGIDVWAIEEAQHANVVYGASLTTREFPPKSQRWEPEGYKERNILIAHNSDKVICITLAELPLDFKGMRFGLCYHCKSTKHIKSGGCWTVKHARSIHRQGEVWVISPDGSVVQES